MDDQLPVGGLRRTIPDSNRLEIFDVRFFLISDVLGTIVFARTHLGRSGLNWISNDYFLFFLDDMWSYFLYEITVKIFFLK
jgi:hypothetical protein